MFQFTKGKLTITEVSNGFEISYDPRSEEDRINHINENHVITKGMGDGVDMFSDASGRSIMVGTPLFYRELRKMLSKDYDTLLDAYFPEKRMQACLNCGNLTLGGGYCSKCQKSGYK